VIICVIWAGITEYRASRVNALLIEQSATILELQKDVFELKLRRIDPGDLTPAIIDHLDGWRADI
jgi:hypothetical protein